MITLTGEDLCEAIGKGFGVQANLPNHTIVNVHLKCDVKIDADGKTTVTPFAEITILNPNDATTG